MSDQNYCTNCKEPISNKSKWCSDKCRKSYSRSNILISDRPIEKELIIETPEDNLFHKDHYITKNGITYCIYEDCGYKIDILNEWSHSKCWKSLKEIQSHYTNANLA